MKRFWNLLRQIINRPGINLLIIIVLSFIFILNVLFQLISFVNPVLNASAIGLFLLVPFILIINGFFFRKWWLKIINAIFFAIPSLVSIFFFTNPIYLIYIAVLEPDQQIKLQSYNLAFYKTGGYFIDRYQGFIVKQEKMIFPGVKLSKQVHQEGNFPLYRVDYRFVGENKILLDFLYFDGNNQQQKMSRLLDLKTFVYF
jgi:hypothetical protein